MQNWLNTWTKKQGSGKYEYKSQQKYQIWKQKSQRCRNKSPCLCNLAKLAASLFFQPGKGESLTWNDYAVMGCAPNIFLWWRSRYFSSFAAHNIGDAKLSKGGSRSKVNVCSLLACLLHASPDKTVFRKKEKKEYRCLRTAPKNNLWLKYIDACSGGARALQRMVNHVVHLKMNISFENRKAMNE